MEEERLGGRGLALLLAVAALLAGAIGARTSLLASSASGLWQQAVRQEVKAAAAAVEDIRFVYGDEASQAFRAVEAAVRAEEYRAAAEGKTGLTRSVLLAEAAAQDQLREILIVNSSTSRRILAMPATTAATTLVCGCGTCATAYPDLLAIRPDDPQAAGDRLARQAISETAVGIPIALTFLFGSLAQGFRRVRRPLLALGTVSLLAAIVATAFIELNA